MQSYRTVSLIIHTEISRRSHWSPGSNVEAGKSWNVSAILRPQTRLGLCSNFADVNKTSLEEACQKGRRKRSFTDPGVPRRQEGKLLSSSLSIHCASEKKAPRSIDEKTFPKNVKNVKKT